MLTDHLKHSLAGPPACIVLVPGCSLEKLATFFMQKLNSSNSHEKQGKLNAKNLVLTRGFSVCKYDINFNSNRIPFSNL